MTSAVDFQNSPSEDPHQARYRIGALVWATALLIVSLQPIRPGSIDFGMVHRLAHFLCFGALAFLATRGFGAPDRISLLPASESFIFGFAIEFLQHCLNRMSIEWYDVRDDAVGILAFTALFYATHRGRIGTRKKEVSDGGIVSAHTPAGTGGARANNPCESVSTNCAQLP
jgi:hypothetical protein